MISDLPLRPAVCLDRTAVGTNLHPEVSLYLDRIGLEDTQGCNLHPAKSGIQTCATCASATPESNKAQNEAL